MMETVNKKLSRSNLFLFVILAFVFIIQAITLVFGYRLAQAVSYLDSENQILSLKLENQRLAQENIRLENELKTNK